MRRDMAKVIVERPRILEGSPRKGRGLDEDLPSKIGMRRHQRLRGGFKMLNENLSPLRRFLHKQVGRRWDDVYSEIAENLRADNTVQQHVRDHIRDFVDIIPGPEQWYTTILPDGTKERRLRPSWRDLYVDPRDGILKRNKAREGRAAWRRHKEKKLIDTVVLDGMHELKLIGGIWFEVTYAPLPDPVYREFDELRYLRRHLWAHTPPTVAYPVKVRRLISRPVFDVVLGVKINLGPPIDDNGMVAVFRRQHPRYARDKRQASKKLLRRHGLRNTATMTYAPV